MKSQNKITNSKTIPSSAKTLPTSTSCPSDETPSQNLLELIEAASGLPEDHLDLLAKIAHRISPE